MSYVFIPICSRCRRKLKSAASIQRGMGPSCWKKHKREQDHQQASLLDGQRTNERV